METDTLEIVCPDCDSTFSVPAAEVARPARLGCASLAVACPHCEREFVVDEEGTPLEDGSPEADDLFEVDPEGELADTEVLLVRCPHCQQVQEVTEPGFACCTFCRRCAPAEAWEEVVAEPRPPHCFHCGSSLEAIDGLFQICPECGWEEEPDDWTLVQEAVTCEQLGYPPLTCPGCGLTSGDEFGDSFLLRYDGRAECPECGRRFVPDTQLEQEEEEDEAPDEGADEPLILPLAAAQA